MSHFSKYVKRNPKSPQSLKNHSTVRLAGEQVELMVPSVNYQNLKQNQPAGKGGKGHRMLSSYR